MNLIAELISSRFAALWDAANTVLLFLGAIGVVGESISHLVPARLLPPILRPEQVQANIARRSTVLLVLVAVLLVPVTLVREHLADEKLQKLEADISLSTQPRIFIDEARAQRLVSLFKHYSGSKYWIITQTNDYNKNSEQMRFSAQLTSILNLAGWERADLKLPIYERVSDRGILIAYRADDQQSKSAYEAISSYLSQFGMRSLPDPTTDIPSDTFLFTVGVQ